MAGAYPSFCNMKRLRVLLHPPEMDASPSQGYPQQYVTGTFFHTPGWRETMWGKVSCLLGNNTMAGTTVDVKPPTFRSEAQCNTHYPTYSHVYMEVLLGEVSSAKRHHYGGKEMV